jgi:hypothetical protein
VPAVAGRDGDVHHVPRVDVARDDQVAREAVFFRVEGAEANRGRLRDLAREHRARPRRGVRRALDLLDAVQVAELEAAELDRLDAHESHYVRARRESQSSGTRSSARRKVTVLP